MQTFVIVSALIATAFGAPSAILRPTIIAAQSPLLSQYHSQDTLGQYAYGYNGGSSAKVETKTLDGITRGSYSYIDANNILQTVEYVADATNGFRAAATNLPKAPIALANEIAVGPEPVRDTPEVAQAKIEHERAFNEAALRAAASPETPAVVAAPAVPVAAPTPVIALRTALPAFSYAFNTPTWIGAGTQFAGPIIAARASPIVIQLGPDGAPIDTPEVAQARAEHLRLVEEQKERIARAQ